jgi:Tol biopolymer transport system component
VYLRDLRVHRTVRISRTASGGPANGASFAPQLAADGRLVFFQTLATNLTAHGGRGIVVWNRATSAFRRVTPASSALATRSFAVSPDGRFITYQTHPGGDQVRLREKNRRTGRSWLVSVDTAGMPFDGMAGTPAISADGRYVAWFVVRLRRPDVLFPGQLWLRDSRLHRTTLVSVGVDGRPGDIAADVRDGGSYDPSISADGRYVTFYSGSDNLVRDDPNHHPDVFIRRIH